MSIKHENFDARVVGIVSGQIPKSEEDVEKTYFYVFDEESQSLIPAPRIHIALQSKERLEGYRQDRKGGVWSFLEDAGVESSRPVTRIIKGNHEWACSCQYTFTYKWWRW